jgi:hypothetical protein
VKSPDIESCTFWYHSGIEPSDLDDHVYGPDSGIEPFSNPLPRISM